VETQSIEGHTHRTPLAHRATNCYGSVVVAIDLNRRCGICIHPLHAGDKGVANALSLEHLKKVLVRDPIKSISEVKGKHA